MCSLYYINSTTTINVLERGIHVVKHSTWCVISVSQIHREEERMQSRQSVELTKRRYPLKHYDARRGDCPGHDIQGITVTTELCAAACDMAYGCVGFVYDFSKMVNCWLKERSCNQTSGRHTARMYDNKDHTQISP